MRAKESGAKAAQGVHTPGWTSEVSDANLRHPNKLPHKVQVFSLKVRVGSARPGRDNAPKTMLRRILGGEGWAVDQKPRTFNPKPYSVQTESATLLLRQALQAQLSYPAETSRRVYICVGLLCLWFFRVNIFSCTPYVRMYERLYACMYVYARIHPCST